MKPLLFSYGYMFATVTLGIVGDYTGSPWFIAAATGTAILSTINYVRYTRIL